MFLLIFNQIQNFYKWSCNIYKILKQGKSSKKKTGPCFIGSTTFIIQKRYKLDHPVIIMFIHFKGVYICLSWFLFKNLFQKKNIVQINLTQNPINIFQS